MSTQTLPKLYGPWFELTKKFRHFPVPSEVNPGMYLTFPKGNEWYLNIDDIYYSGSYIEQMWTEAFAAIRAGGFSPKSVLVLGQGAGSCFFAARSVFGAVELTGVDMDPAIVQLGTAVYSDDFSTRRTQSIQSRLGIPKSIFSDAQTFLRETSSSYDLIVIDLFVHEHPAPVVATQEFIDAVIARLTPGGYVLVNIYKDAFMADPWKRALLQHSMLFILHNQILAAHL